MTAEDVRHRHTGANPVFYMAMLPGLVQLAREHGYAIAVHGSMSRDFDLIACPWTEAAVSADELVKLIMLSTGAQRRHRADWEQKPHMRRSFCLYLGGGPYLDLSIMPRACDAAHHMQPEEIIHDEGI